MSPRLQSASSRVKAESRGAWNLNVTCESTSQKQDAAAAAAAAAAVTTHVMLVRLLTSGTLTATALQQLARAWSGVVAGQGRSGAGWRCVVEEHFVHHPTVQSEVMEQQWRAGAGWLRGCSAVAAFAMHYWHAQQHEQQHGCRRQCEQRAGRSGCEPAGGTASAGHRLDHGGFAGERRHVDGCRRC